MNDSSRPDPSTKSDEELLSDLSSGEDVALAVLAGRHARGVYDFALRGTLDAQQAADVTIAVFRRVRTAGREVPIPVSFRTWLYSLGLIEVLAVANEARTERISSGDERFYRAEGGVDPRIAHWAWQAARSPRTRDYCVLDLTLRRGLTPEEVADAASLTRSNLYASIGRARVSFEEAYAAILLFEYGRGACPTLNEIVENAPGDGMRPVMQHRITEHSDDCDACRTSLAAMPLASNTFVSLADVELPQDLPRRILGIADAAPAAQAEPAPVPGPEATQAPEAPEEQALETAAEQTPGDQEAQSPAPGLPGALAAPIVLGGVTAAMGAAAATPEPGAGEPTPVEPAPAETTSEEAPADEAPLEPAVAEAPAGEVAADEPGAVEAQADDAATSETPEESPEQPGPEAPAGEEAAVAIPSLLVDKDSLGPEPAVAAAAQDARPYYHARDEDAPGRQFGDEATFDGREETLAGRITGWVEAARGQRILWSYAMLGVATVLVIYLGVAVADSIRAGGASSGALPLDATADVTQGMIIECSAEPIVIQGGEELVVNFDPAALSGFEIVGGAVSPVSPMAAFDGLEATLDDPHTMRFIAAAKETETERLDDYEMRISWARGDEQATSSCPMQVRLTP